MLNFLNISGTNFRSFESFDFNFKSGLFVVTGINRDDEFSDSNGAGKSSLLTEAPYWCLTGKTLNGIPLDDLVKGFDKGKDCMVKLTLRDKDNDIVVTRYRKHSQFDNGLRLEINGQDVSANKVADTQERLDQLIRIPAANLKSLIIMSADLTNRFTSLTPQERVNVLETLRNYEIWGKVKESAQAKAKDINDQIKVIEADHNVKLGKIEVITENINKLADRLVTLKNTPDNSDVIEALNKTMEKCKSDKIPLEESVASLNKTLSETDGYIKQLEDERATFYEGINKVEDQIRDLHQSTFNITRRIRDIDELKSKDKCPMCGSDISLPESQIKELDNERQTKLQEVEKINDEISKLESKVNDMKSQSPESKINDAMSSKVSTTSTISDINKKIREIDQDIIIIEGKISNFKYEDETRQSKIQEVESDLKNDKRNLLDLKSSLDDNSESIKKLNEEKKYFDFYVDALGHRGALRPYLLSRDIDFVNKSLNFYSKTLFSELLIQLSKPTINNPHIDIYVTKKDTTVPVGSLSTGERRRCDLLIQFALYDLMHSCTSYSLNLLVLDEVLIGIDYVGISKIVELLKSRKDYIPSIYLITNNPNVSELVEDKIYVEKVNDSSVIRD